jgi:ATP-binding protein involved in chromosome partitioning
MPAGKIEVAEVNRVLAEIADPEIGRDIVQMEQIHDIEITDSALRIQLGLTTHSAPLWDETKDLVEQRLRGAFPVAQDVSVEIVPHDRPAEKIGEVGIAAKSVVAVGSGKGGVGKSTIAVSLAYGLKRAGCKVGLMDADVYGPSVPHLLGIEGRPEVVDKQIQPLEKDGLKVMSMGFLVPPEEAVVWRGPMLHGAITQFLRDTAWGDLDYLIIDMPPGTGDIALTLSQLLPLTGSVIVCTPQDVALLDAVKAIAMCHKVNIKILGIVENMSGFVCPDCGKRYEIFSSGGARRRAEQDSLPFLGEVPINLEVCKQGDAGRMNALLDDPVIGPVLSGLSYRLAKNIATAHASEPPLPSLNVL